MESFRHLFFFIFVRCIIETQMLFLNLTTGVLEIEIIAGVFWTYSLLYASTFLLCHDNIKASSIQIFIIFLELQ